MAEVPVASGLLCFSEQFQLHVPSTAALASGAKNRAPTVNWAA